MGRTKKMVAMVATAMLAAATLVWMQGRFEGSDERHAVELVQAYRSKTGVSIPDLLSHHHPGKGVSWTSRVKSSCFQHVEVEATVIDDPEPVTYLFVVDINGPAIHPGNEAGRRLLTEMNQPLSAAPSASATVSAHSASGIATCCSSSSH